MQTEDLLTYGHHLVRLHPRKTRDVLPMFSITRCQKDQATLKPTTEPKGTKKALESMPKKVTLWPSPVSFVITLLLMMHLWLHTNGKTQHMLEKLMLSIGQEKGLR